MKATLITLTILLFSITLSAGLFDYFEQISDQAAEHVREKAGDGFTFAHPASVFGGLVSEDNKISMTYSLEEGVEYNVFVYGDEDANDLDIKIYDSEGNMVESDTSVSETASLDFTPEDDGVYTIEAINYSSEDNVFLLCGVMTETDNDDDAEEIAEHFVEAFENMIEYGTDIDDEHDISFYTDAITFSGGIIEEEGSGTLYDLSFPEDAEVILAACGSDNTTDVDVKLTRQRRQGEVDTSWYADDRELVCSDSSVEDKAFAEGEVKDNRYYAAKYRNYSSEGDAFILFFLVKN